MNPIRQALSNLFNSPIQNMTYISYMQYVNTAGKITARSLMDMCTILFTFVEEQERKIELFEQNFKEIEGILQKIVDKKAGTVTIPITEEAFENSTLNYPPVEVADKIAEEIEKATDHKTPETTYKCETCGKEVKSLLALNGHMRSHKTKEM